MHFPRILSCLILSLAFAACKSNDQQQAVQDLVPADTSARSMQIMDSLLRHTESSSRILALRKIRQQAFVRNEMPDSVLQEAFRIQQLALRLNDSLSYAHALLPVAGELNEAQFKLLEISWPMAMGILERRGFHLEQAILLNHYAKSLNGLGRYDESQKAAFTAIALPGLNKADSLKARLFLTIAENYAGNNSLNDAYQYYHAARMTAALRKDSLFLSSILLDMGILYYDAKSDSADHYYAYALKSLPAKGGSLLKMRILYNISVQDFEAGKQQLALAGFRHLLAVSRSEGLRVGEAVAYKALGFFHEAYGRPDSAVHYLNRSIGIADSMGKPLLKIQGLIELEKAYRTLRDEAKAFRQHLMTDAIRDSMFTVDKQAVIHGMEMQYDRQIRDLENAGLKKSLRIRQSLLILAGVICMGLWFIWRIERQRSRLLAERNLSYRVLMERYKSERLARSMHTNPEPEVSHSAADPAAPLQDAGSISSDNQGMQESLYIELQHLFREKAVYKDQKLKIEDVSAWLNIPPRQIASILKEREGINFRQFVNKYRIREARRLLEDPDALNLKLEVIGERAGFASRSHFQRVFESVVGVTPGYYRQNILDENTAGSEDAVEV